MARLLGLAVSAILALGSPSFLPDRAVAQPYPSRTVTLLVPFPAGSATDAAARKIAEHLRVALGQPVIVDNKPGADGIIAARIAARAEPDGYTVFITTNTTHAANVSIYTSLPYDPRADFLPVGGIMKIPLLLAVKPDFPANDMASFLRIAKSRSLTFGSGNTSSRAAAELLKSRAGLDMLHVPYRGTPQALTDLIGGSIDVFFPDGSSGQAAIQGGQVRILGVTSAERMQRLPSVPTIAESGFPGYEMVAWVGAFVPAKTPAAVVARLNGELNRALDQPDLLAFFEAVNAQQYKSTPEDLRRFVDEDIQRWADIVRIAGIEKKSSQ